MLQKKQDHLLRMTSLRPARLLHDHALPLYEKVLFDDEARLVVSPGGQVNRIAAVGLADGVGQRGAGIERIGKSLPASLPVVAT